MKKPNDFEQAEGNSTTFLPITLGGHKAVIMDAEEVLTKDNKPMLKVAFDFDKADSQPGYFKDRYTADDREDKKWPWNAYMYLTTEDAAGNTTRWFKSFCNDVESSNPGFNIKWGENFGIQFKGKKIGVVFGEEEYINQNGDKAVSVKFKWTCDYNNAESQAIPKLKELKVQPIVTGTAEGFTPIPEGADEDIPF